MSVGQAEHRFFTALGACLILCTAAAACTEPTQQAVPPVCDLPAMFVKSPTDDLAGPGWHRLYTQGSGATSGADGRFGLTEHRADVELGDQFLLSSGALVEWSYPVLEPLTGRVSIHVAHVEDLGTGVLYELFLVHDGHPIELLHLEDASNGESGWHPLVGCFHGSGATVRPVPGDHLLLRITNETGGYYGVVVNSPDHFTWLEVEVD